MTLTSILPSLRRSIPDPIDAGQWPADTRATTTDVIVGTVSMLHLAEISATPCVHIGRAAANGTRRLETALVGVAVVRVSASVVDAAGSLHVALEHPLDGLDPIWSETRLIGRASTARARAAELGTAIGVRLPGDVRAADLLAIPYRCVTPAGDAARRGSGWGAESRTVSPAPVA